MTEEESHPTQCTPSQTSSMAAWECGATEEFRQGGSLRMKEEEVEEEEQKGKISNDEDGEGEKEKVHESVIRWNPTRADVTVAARFEQVHSHHQLVKQSSEERDHLECQDTDDVVDDEQESHEDHNPSVNDDAGRRDELVKRRRGWRKVKRGEEKPLQKRGMKKQTREEKHNGGGENEGEKEEEQERSEIKSDKGDPGQDVKTKHKRPQCKLERENNSIKHLSIKTEHGHNSGDSEQHVSVKTEHGHNTIRLQEKSSDGGEGEEEKEKKRSEAEERSAREKFEQDVEAEQKQVYDRLGIGDQKCIKEENHETDIETPVRRSQRVRTCVMDSHADMMEGSDSEEDEHRRKRRLTELKHSAGKEKGDAAGSVRKAGKRRERMGPFICDTCGLSCPNRATMARHQLTHTGEKPFECEECGKRFVNSTNLRIHQTIHAGTKDHMCNECGQQFTHLVYLKRHLLRHAEDKPHICPICGKGFVQKYHLDRHRRTHELLRCHVCSEAFARSQTLAAHVRKEHPGEEMETEEAGTAENTRKARGGIPCELCGKVCLGPSQLLQHVRVHTGEKPYSCLMCERRFAQKSQLNAHVRTHTGEKPWVCPLCLKSFTRRTYMDQHRRNAHGEKL